MENRPSSQNQGTSQAVITNDERQRCEVWTRVMGYHRPVSSFNKGKQSEYADRVCFTEK